MCRKIAKILFVADNPPPPSLRADLNCFLRSSPSPPFPPSTPHRVTLVASYQTEEARSAMRAAAPPNLRFITMRGITDLPVNPATRRDASPLPLPLPATEERSPNRICSSSPSPSILVVFIPLSKEPIYNAAVATGATTRGSGLSGLSPSPPLASRVPLRGGPREVVFDGRYKTFAASIPGGREEEDRPVARDRLVKSRSSPSLPPSTPYTTVNHHSPLRLPLLPLIPEPASLSAVFLLSRERLVTFRCSNLQLLLPIRGCLPPSPSPFTLRPFFVR